MLRTACQVVFGCKYKLKVPHMCLIDFMANRMGCVLRCCVCTESREPIKQNGNKMNLSHSFTVAIGYLMKRCSHNTVLCAVPCMSSCVCVCVQLKRPKKIDRSKRRHTKLKTMKRTKQNLSANRHITIR